MKITRRAVLLSAAAAGGALVVGSVGLGTYVQAFDRKGLQQHAVGPRARMVAQWIRIDDDGTVTLLAPHTEMGQGSQTSLLQIVLDELDADPDKTVYELAPADPAFTHSDAIAGFLMGEEELTGWSGTFIKRLFGRMGQLGGIQFTGGSSAIRFTGWRGIRRAAASARMMLKQAAATRLGVPVAELTTERGEVVHAATGQRLGYGTLAGDAAVLPLPEAPAFKAREDYAYIGTAYPRIDIPEKVFGKPVYGIDTDVPNMRYAAVAPPPIMLGTITDIQNRAEIEARRGVEAVLLLSDCVVVVADNPWRAEQAAKALVLAADPPESGLFDHVASADKRRRAVSDASSLVIEHGDGAGELTGKDVVEARYETPFYIHAPMEPMNATVWEADGLTHVATGAQGPLAARTTAADTLGLAMERVRLHPKTMGGGFGRRNGLVAECLNYIRIACETHNAVGGALKLTMSREAGLRMNGGYHPADAARFRARLDSTGRPTHWHSQLYAPVGLPEESRPSYDIPHVSVHTVGAEPDLPEAAWRSVGAYTNVLFIESFIDELAAHTDQDPIAYRTSLLQQDPRLARALRTVAEMSNWRGRRVGDRAFGVASAESFGSKVAVVVEASQRDGIPTVHNVWCAIDCGTPINPGSVEAQVQGGIFWGLSAALYGEVTFKDGTMVESNLHNYRVNTFVDAPRIYAKVLVDPDAPVGGVGEAATPLAAPALANALAAFGERRRVLPFGKGVA